jgi:hypothetical protein
MVLKVKMPPPGWKLRLSMKKHPLFPRTCSNRRGSEGAGRGAGGAGPTAGVPLAAAQLNSAPHVGHQGVA